MIEWNRLYTEDLINRRRELLKNPRVAEPVARTLACVGRDIGIDIEKGVEISPGSGTGTITSTVRYRCRGIATGKCIGTVRCICTGSEKGRNRSTAIAKYLAPERWIAKYLAAERAIDKNTVQEIDKEKEIAIALALALAKEKEIEQEIEKVNKATVNEQAKAKETEKTKGKSQGPARGNGREKEHTKEQVVKNNIDTKIKSNPLKLIVDMNKGGYNSYFKNKAFLGEIFEFLNDNLSEEIDVRFKKNVLNLLEDGKIYSVLLQVSYISEGQVKRSSPMKSIIITKNINIYNVIHRFKIAINKFIDESELSNYSGKCFVC